MSDHAKKGRPSKSAPKRRSTKKSKPPINPRIWVMLAMAAVACAGFGYFLFSIDGSAKPAEVKTPQQKTLPKQPTQALPEAPTSTWSYEDLDQKEIEVDLPEQQEATRPYRLQCGSFKTLGQAETMKAKIAFQGYGSFIKKVQGKSSPWYQVYLGPFKRKRAAESARHKMQRAGLNHCQIFYWEG